MCRSRTLWGVPPTGSVPALLRAVVAGVVVLATLVLAGPAPAATTGAPVRLSAVTADVASATVGQRVTFQASGKGLRSAGRTRVTFYLSTDARLDEGDLRLGSATVKTVRRARALAVRLAAKIPSRAGLRTSRVLACVAYRSGERARCSCRTAATPLATRRLPRPLTAKPELQADRAVTRQVGAAGGTLRTTAANGATLVLTIPAGALDATETVTMTPIGGIGGLRRSGLSVGGASLAPEGLLLARTATLRIVPPRRVAEDRVTGYAFRGAGGEFHFKPAVADGDAIEVEVPHFSGAGAADATIATRNAVTGSSQPTSPSDQGEQQQALTDGDMDYYNRLSEESAAKGAVGSGGDHVQDLYDLAGAIRPWTEWRKKTLAEAAALQASGAVPKAKAIADQWIKASWELLRWHYPQRIALARLACADHRLEAAPALRYITDVTLAIPDPIDTSFSSVAPKADEAILACLNFDVDVFTQIRASAGDDVTMETTATIPVAIKRVRSPEFAGEAVPKVSRYDVTAPSSCWTHPPASVQPSPVSVDGVTVQGLVGRPRDWYFGNEVDKGRLWGVYVSMGTVRETLTHEAHCEGQETFTNEMNVYNAGVAALGQGSEGMGLRNGVGLPATGATRLWAGNLQRLDEDTWLRVMDRSSDPRISGQIRIRIEHRPRG